MRFLWKYPFRTLTEKRIQTVFVTCMTGEPGSADLRSESCVWPYSKLLQRDPKSALCFNFILHVAPWLEEGRGGREERGEDGMGNRVEILWIQSL